MEFKSKIPDHITSHPSMPKYKPVIGLEIHAQLDSRSKIYSSEAVDYGGEPNSRVSEISLGLPGVLPSLNKACVELAIKMGLATGCSIANECYFARKNYFYPDLPKGYQISQDNTPICFDGEIKIRTKDINDESKIKAKTIRIQRIHMEEDSGKSFHDQDLYDSLVDLNRAGVGLIEIVSHPDIENAEQAMAYLTEIRKLVRYIGVCDGNMEEGSLRCDANVSVMPVDAKEYGTRTEIKNLNSISNVGRAINYEIERQIALLESGGAVMQETRTWDAGTGRTSALRDKETSADYRYFPEPDLLPLNITPERLAEIRQSLPELPEALYQKYVNSFSLPDHDATLLTEHKEFARYFEEVISIVPNYKAASNWLNGSVKSFLNEQAIEISDFRIPPQKIADIIILVDTGKVSHNVAKEEIFKILLKNPEISPEKFAEENNLILSSNVDEINEFIKQVVSENEGQVNTYLQGKTGLLGFFVGKVMKLTAGKADPKEVHRLTTDYLEKLR